MFTHINRFKTFVWQFYKEFGRSFAWRNVQDPYLVLVSEIMLQQTQTYRVEPKFDQFIAAFPDVFALADAELRDVLGLWQGLGYNRRGKALWENAKRIVAEYNGTIPEDPEVLKTFSHIGPNTAASIAAFAYNKPVVFVETNIRAVYLHTFFKDRDTVKDAELMPLIEQTLDPENPREWYYALMDYGVHLKKTLPNPSRKSAHHSVQSKFEGSDRQIRGRILKLLTQHERVAEELLLRSLGTERDRYERILDAMCVEGMVQEKEGSFFL